MSFTWNGFRLMPGKGLVLLLGFLLAMAVGLAYSVSMALKNSERVGQLEQALKASRADLEAYKGIVHVQRIQAQEHALEQAKTQEKLNEAQRKIERAGSGKSGAERVRSKRDAAQSTLSGSSPLSAPGNVPSGGPGASGSTFGSLGGL